MFCKKCINEYKCKNLYKYFCFAMCLLIMIVTFLSIIQITKEMTDKCVKLSTYSVSNFIKFFGERRQKKG